MTRLLVAAFVTALVFGTAKPVRADDKDAMAIVDKAIKAAGGEEKLSKAKVLTWKTKGKMTVNGEDNEISSQMTADGLGHFHQEFDGEFGGNKIQGVFVLAGDKGWRKFGDMSVELDKNGVANQKRVVYLQVVPITLVQLKTKDFKIETADEDKVGGKSAIGIKATGPDGKDFKLYFDKDSGLPVKLVAKVAGFQGNEVTQESTFGNYKEIDGIKKATKIDSKRDGQKFQDFEVTEFKVLEKADPKLFVEPK